MYGGRRAGRYVVAAVSVVATVAALALPGRPAAAASGPEGTATVVVQLAPGARPSPAMLQSVHATSHGAGGGQRLLLAVPAASARAARARLAATPGVVYADVARPVHATATVSDPCYTACPAYDENGTPGVRSEGYLARIGAPGAWSVSKGSGVTIAVIDSGVDPAQPDLAGKLVPHGTRSEVDVCAAPPTADPLCQQPRDEFGHGTHVSGIAGAETDNAYGVASLGWDVRLDEYQVLDSTGSGNTADVATAVYDAVAAGDRVINLSLANDSCDVSSDCGPDPDEEAAVEYAISHNVVVVAAAGNDGSNQPAYPASYPGVLSVAATDNNGVVQSFSQWGSAADIAAPGSEIVSTWPTYAVGAAPACADPVPATPPGPVCALSGTSMAAPQVSAAAALILSRYPALSAPQVVDAIESSARPAAGGHPIAGGVLWVPGALAAAAAPPRLYRGYEIAAADGRVDSFGTTGFFGDASGHPLARPVVGVSLTADGRGYWLDASDGGVFTFGDARFLGSMGGKPLAAPVVGMASTPTGHGYWLVAADGGIFTFGDAPFLGSMGGVRLAAPVVGMAATPSGHGYWLVAADGGVFCFGDAGFHGSMGGVHLVAAVVGMASTPSGHGYWMVGSDGGVFTFGDAGFHGSMGGVRLAAPVVGIASTPSGHGYWMEGADGGVFTFGDAGFHGSGAGSPHRSPFVGISS